MVGTSFFLSKSETHFFYAGFLEEEGEEIGPLCFLPLLVLGRLSKKLFWHRVREEGRRGGPSVHVYGR